MQLNPTFVRSAHPDIASLVRYCSELAGEEHMPRRSRFRPPRLGAVLGYFFLIDALCEENDYFFSLAGERMVVLFGGENLKGKRLSQVGDPVLRQSLRRTYDRVVSSHLPLYMRGHYVWPNKSVEIERLLLPMAGDDGRLSTICGLVIPTVPDADVELHVGRGAARLVGDEQLVLAA